MLSAVRILVRLLSLALSFCFSTLGAATFFTFALFLGGDPAWLKDDLGVVAGATAFLAVAWFSIAQLAFIPVALIFLIAEFARIRSFTLNILAGGLCALVVLVLYPLSIGPWRELPYGPSEGWLAGLGAGFVGGFIHWALAGHRAGAWLGTQPTEEETASDPR